MWSFDVTSPDDIGRITINPVDNDGFKFYAGSEFWLGKALELDMGADALYETSKRLITDRAAITPSLKIDWITRYWLIPFPPDPRLGAGIWQTIMLAGFALENVFKALLINSCREKIAYGKLEGFDHRLVELAKASDFTLSNNETRLCEVCTHALVCAGRYPTSIKARDLAAEWHVDLDNAWSVYKPLFERSFSLACMPR